MVRVPVCPSRRWPLGWRWGQEYRWRGRWWARSPWPQWTGSVSQGSVAEGAELKSSSWQRDVMMQDSEPQVLGQDQGFEMVSQSEEDTSLTSPQRTHFDSGSRCLLLSRATWSTERHRFSTEISGRMISVSIKCYWKLSHRKDSLKISAVYVRVCVTAQDRALNKVLPVGRTLDTLTMFLWTFFSLKAALEQDFLGDGHL